jgi:enoyl-[acyl-carrier protein] reductase I
VSVLAGRRGLVVGVSGERSLGWPIACALADRGAELAIACRPRRHAQVAALAEPRGFDTYPIDVDDPASTAAAFAALERSWGRLDFLVHSVVHVPDGLLDRSLLDVTRGDFERVVSVAAYSLIALCGHARLLFRASTGPRVVTLTSSGSRRALPRYHVAGIAKAALESAVGYLALELGRDGVLVNGVCAGLVGTDGARRALGAANVEAARARLARRALTGRATDAGDVAECVAWLASPSARNITGEILRVDGGVALVHP